MLEEFTFICNRCCEKIKSGYYFVHPTELMGQFCNECYDIMEKEAISKGETIRNLAELHNPILYSIRNNFKL